MPRNKLTSREFDTNEILFEEHYIESDTAFFSSMPGGSGEMVNLGARNGAVLSRVAAGQSLRMQQSENPLPLQIRI